MLALIIRSAAIALLVARAKSHKSLTDLGILTAIVTAVIHSAARTSLYLTLIFAFYLTSSQFTKYKHEIKKSLTATESTDAASTDATTRNHIQVLANSIGATVCVLLDVLTGQKHNALLVGAIANYAAVTADTWSSELGILSKTQPILITTLRPCPKGTNGGVSPLGLKVAAGGGLMIGLISAVMLVIGGRESGDGVVTKWSLVKALTLVIFTTALGFFGSILDSLLGAVFQKSVVNRQGKIIESAGGHKLNQSGAKVCSGKLDLLSNNQVNVLMALITTVLGAVLWSTMFD